MTGVQTCALPICQVLEVEAVDARELRTELQTAIGAPVELVDGLLRVEGERVHELVPRIVDFAGERVRRIALAPPSLEDVFVSLTGRHIRDA